MTSRWRPKNRRQILQLDDEGSQSPVVQPVTIPAPPSKLQALLGHYESDEEAKSDDPTESEFKDFMKEIESTPVEPVKVQTVWQELWDPQSGQPYYWHTVTNELTWEKPPELTKSPKPDPPQTAKELPKPSDVPEKQVKEEKVSFKWSDRTVSAKTNGRLTIEADEIIAAIEKEIPPDHPAGTGAIVPLFRRRVPDPPAADRPRLGTDFKKFFPGVERPVLEDPTASTSSPVVVNTYRGLGYRENETETATKPAAPLKFVAGEVLVPMVVPVSPQLPVALTLDEKLTRLEKSACNDVAVTAQLLVLRDAWQRKKLEVDYLEEWVDARLIDFKPPEEDPPSTVADGSDQVVDMVLENSASDQSTPEPPKQELDTVVDGPPGEELDTALSSFYSDLAELDAAAVTSGAEAAPVVPERPVEGQQETGGIIRSTKRTKMSSDMTSLVAKWQKVNQS